MKLKVWEISLMVALVIAVLWGVLLDSGQRELSDKLIRLHVVANSDTEEDQALKLRVRDAVLDEIDLLLTGGESKAEVQGKIENSLNDLRRRAEDEIAESGGENPINVSLETEHFPTREYETFSLPAGNYTSLKVSIGAAEGRNWWCVVFPPLCMEAAEAEAEAETEGNAKGALAVTGLTDDEVALITEEDRGYVIKFKALELLDDIKSFFNCD